MNTKETKIPRMRTLPKAIEEIRATDPESQLTLATLRKLVKRGSVKSVPLGNYSLVDLDQLIEVLTCGFVVTGKTEADFSGKTSIVPLIIA